MVRNGICERLHDAVKDIWEKYYAHPFVRGIADGTLPVEKFRYYMLQDYLYLFDYARVFAVGVTKARDRALMQTFARHVSVILDGEMQVHRAYMERLGITGEQVDDVKPALDNVSYTNYMLSAAHAGGEAEIVAAILSCSWSYAEIGRRVAQKPGAAEHEFFGEWVKSYSSQGYNDANDELMGLMESLAAGLDEERLRHITDIFVNCSRYELNFWDMAWEMRD